MLITSAHTLIYIPTLIDEEPIQMWLRYYATLGGLHINDQMQVLNTSQEPIEGLYAAGEVVGGLEGDIYYGGSLFGWAMTSGYDAAMSVTAE